LVITVSPGPVANLSVTPSPSQLRKSAGGTGTSNVALEASDQFGNPAGGVAVTVVATPGVGTVDGSPATLDTAGKGSVTLTSGPGQFGTATLTATADNPGLIPDVTKTATIQAILDRTGEPANVFLEVSPADGKITIARVGGNERATITARVVDVEGNPIDDSAITSNIEFEITKAPGNSPSEKPYLDGQDGAGVLTLTTVSGVVSANLQSGTRPGTVEIAVRITRAKDGSLLSPPLSVVVPQITIEAGPAASLFLSRSNAISSNGDGTITHEYFAVLSDVYGNAVTDGTSVFFGQFLNILGECRTLPPADNPLLPLAETLVPTVGFVPISCASGTLSADGTVSAPSALFSTNGVSPGDTWVMIAKQNPLGLGGYTVDAVAGETQLNLETTFGFGADVAGLEWAVGNNKNLSGGVFTPVEVPTKDGIARWPNTYAGELINHPVYIYAETGGKGLGHARWFHLSGAAPLAISSIDGGAVAAGSTVVFGFSLTDGSAPTPYRVPNYLVKVGVNGGTLGAYTARRVHDRAWEEDPLNLWLVTTPQDPTAEYPGGDASFYWVAPAAVSGTDFTIQISAGGVVQKVTMTIK
jgi:hypothetical protein